MIKLFFRTLYPPLSHYLLLNNTRKTLDFVVTCISNKMTLLYSFIITKEINYSFIANVFSI